VIYENKGIWGEKEFDKLRISPEMEEFIFVVENSAAHCFGCDTQQSAGAKYWNFIWSTKPKRKNKLVVSAPHK
jgi:hypothetical protein